MFKRLKNWLFNRPPEDHIVAGFAWIVGTFAAIGSAVAFPAIASVAVGVASFTYLMALAEGAYGIGGMIGNFCNWAYRKIFKSKKQPTNKQDQHSKTDKQPQAEQEKGKGREQPQPEKDKEQSQTKQENSQPEQENGKGKEQPQPEQDKAQEQSQAEPVEPKQHPITLNSKEFLILIRQMQILMQLLQQTRMELEALRQKNKSLSSENKNPDNLKQFGNSEELVQPISGRRNPANRNYLQNSRFVRH